MSASQYTASCLCGGVKLALSAEPGPIEICHCVMCRKAQGGPFATHAVMPAGALDVTEGAELLANYESSPGIHRMFCKRCGSPLFSTNAEDPQVVRIRVGIIDGPLRTRPSAHYFVGGMANWWRIDDHLLRCETEWARAPVGRSARADRQPPAACRHRGRQRGHARRHRARADCNGHNAEPSRHISPRPRGPHDRHANVSASARPVVPRADGPAPA